MGACMRSLTCSFIRSTAYYVPHYVPYYVPRYVPHYMPCYVPHYVPRYVPHYVSYYVPDTNKHGCLLCTLEGLTGWMACPLLKVKPEEAQEGP